MSHDKVTPDAMKQAHELASRANQIIEQINGYIHSVEKWLSSLKFRSDRIIAVKRPDATDLYQVYRQGSNCYILYGRGSKTWGEGAEEQVSFNALINASLHARLDAAEGVALLIADQLEHQRQHVQDLERSLSKWKSALDQSGLKLKEGA